MNDSVCIMNYSASTTNCSVSALKLSFVFTTENNYIIHMQTIKILGIYQPYSDSNVIH